MFLKFSSLVTLAYSKEEPGLQAGLFFIHAMPGIASV
jgi:hypothetical protein